MLSNRVIRYGYGNVLYRILSVDLNDTTACTGGSLHRVRAVSVRDGMPATWWIRDRDLRRYIGCGAHGPTPSLTN